MRVTTCVLATILALTSLSALADESGEGILLRSVDTFDEIKKLLAPDAEENDEFGYAVAISGDTLVVGAWRDDDACPGDPNCDSGAVYIFERSTGGPEKWGFSKKLTASDGAAYHSFGRAVAIDGDYIVVGAPAMSLSNVYGAAYVFERNYPTVGAWGERKKLISSEAAANDKIGYSVGISGFTAIVGAPYEDTGGNSSGAAYTFEAHYPTSDNWGQTKILRASDKYASDYFGWSVAISGNFAIVGALLEDGPALGDSGAAYVFERDYLGTENWGERKKLMASDQEADDEFGVSVAISNETAVVGSHLDDDACPGDANCDSGSAYVFERGEGGPDNWGEVQKLVASDDAGGDELGISVSVSGARAVVGAFRSDAGEFDAGSAYAFERHHGGRDNWGELQKLGGSDTANSDEFGMAVAISGLTLVSGAHFNDDVCPTVPGCNSGSAYVFQSPNPGLFIAEALATPVDLLRPERLDRVGPRRFPCRQVASSQRHGDEQ